MLRRQLGATSIAVTDNADEAIEFLKTSVIDGQFDLVISDWNLIGPRTGGDVLEWIETHASHLVRRFLFLSSDEAAKGRGVPWVEKGTDVPVLRSTIENVLASHDAW